MAQHAPRNVVITGAARGIGRVIARTLALRGDNIFLLDIQEAELAYTATSHIPQMLREAASKTKSLSDPSSPPTPPHKDSTTTSGPLIGYAVVDLRDPAAITAVIASAAAFFPNHTIDVLINNAGLCKAQFKNGRSMEDPTTAEEWAAYLAVNLTAPFLVSQAVLPYMKTEETQPRSHPFDAIVRPEGLRAAAGYISEAERREYAHPSLQSRSIINISSFRALQSEPNCEGYAASKAGALGLTQAMSISGAQWGIRCNAILPGFTFVDHECRAGDESDGKIWWTAGIEGDRHGHHPVGRIGYGEDVADAVVWLMGAGFVTGQEIRVDGGVSRVKHASA